MNDLIWNKVSQRITLHCDCDYHRVTVSCHLQHELCQLWLVLVLVGADAGCNNSVNLNVNVKVNAM